MNTTKTLSAWTTQTDPHKAFDELAGQIDDRPGAIVFFVPDGYDGSTLSHLLAERFQCTVAGCTTAGEISDRAVQERGVALVAIGADKVQRAAGVLVDFGENTGDAVRKGVQQLASNLKIDVRAVDPRQYVGIVLIDGLSQVEEEVNHALGTAAPGLLFVGGSAGDDLEFKHTAIFLDGKTSSRGAVLVLMEVLVPVAVTKTFSAESTGHRFRVTRAHEATRTVYEIDYKPVLSTYSHLIGVPQEELNFNVFMRYPWAMVEGNDAWIRSPSRAMPDGGLQFFCAIENGMELTVMKQTPIIDATRKAFDHAAVQCGGKVSAAIIFNCVYRRVELDQSDLHREYAELYKNFPTAGFHTYGESMIGHMNQTCTALFFG